MRKHFVGRCGGGPINNNRTSSVIGGIKQVAPNVKLTYSPGAPIADCKHISAVQGLYYSVSCTKYCL
jgi:hypothetical protein